jgi:hypothetical protein
LVAVRMSLFEAVLELANTSARSVQLVAFKFEEY